MVCFGILQMTLAQKMLYNFRTELVMAIMRGNKERIEWLRRHIAMLEKEIEAK